MDEFLKDVDQGLSHQPKRLSSKYFYDQIGSQIFQEIMDMPEYYLTRCEREILNTQAVAIGKALGFQGAFDVVELGAGDGSKTLEMLSHWESNDLEFRYLPMDVSQQAMEDLKAQAKLAGNRFEILPLIGDYFQTLTKIPQDRPKVFLFLGANIGNYNTGAALGLLEQLKTGMQSGDRLMIGLDLQKSSDIILPAYDDPHGITSRFNLNLLQRINTELGGNFPLDKFSFQATYNPSTGELKSYLVAHDSLDVHIAGLGKTYHFQNEERVQTELSKKYSFDEIQALAEAAGFIVNRNFQDQMGYFVDSLWRLA